MIHPGFGWRARYPKPVAVGVSIISQLVLAGYKVVSQIKQMIAETLKAFAAHRGKFTDDLACSSANASHAADRVGPSTVPHLVAYSRELFSKGLPISSSIAESAVNQVVSHRMAKKQQMLWTDEGAHRLAQVRVADPNGELSVQRLAALAKMPGANSSYAPQAA